VRAELVFLSSLRDEDFFLALGLLLLVGLLLVVARGARAGLLLVRAGAGRRGLLAGFWRLLTP